MKLLSTPDELHAFRASLQGPVGFVPTMGALHEGHASLVRQARAANDHVIVSIFVNPTQFGPNEDFSRYPRTLQADLDLLQPLGVAAVFAPAATDIYPQGQAQISFQIRDLDKVLCGASRPGHFNGVLQVVMILFHLVKPTRAYFGKKDFQQFLLLHTMAKELHMEVEVVPCAIIREADGLAMSSRNRYLSPQEREQALFLSRALAHAQANAAHWKNAGELLAWVRSELAAYPLVRPDYAELLDSRTLQPVDSLRPEDHPHLFLAAFLGSTRLIDNGPLWPTD